MTGVISGKNAFSEARPRWPQFDFSLATGKLYRLAWNLTITISPTPTSTPGTIPARNSAATLSPIT